MNIFCILYNPIKYSKIKANSTTKFQVMRRYSVAGGELVLPLYLIKDIQMLLDEG